MMRLDFPHMDYLTIDVGDNPEVAERGGITSLPLVVMLVDGKEVEHLSGSVKLLAIERMIGRHLNG
jgi:thioredoxin-like negative regulator of GroEL